MSENYHLIEQYLDNALPDDKKADFELQLSVDQSLQSELKVHQTARKIAGIMAYNHLKNNHIFESVDNNTRHSKIINLKMSWLLVAASFALILGALLWIWLPKQYDRSQIIGQYAYLGMSSGTRSTNTLTEASYVQILEAYQIGDYSQALERLGELELDLRAHRDLLYLKIYSYIQLRAYQEAELTSRENLDFNKIADQYNFDWISVLIALGNGEDDRLGQLLDTIIADKNHPYHPEALDLQSKINSKLFKLWN
jgi:hypothetical protein